ncbi:unnamed protein product [Linum tenue]|uniref:Uncharacterized protein n=1 Tax=Linum tenue TaxID=586396 RepID=A0AAV0MKJ5_9ROSI|nr:unnamed protein product [Linum tenue]
MGGGDPRPQKSGPGLAGHLRHRRGGRASLRRGRPPLQRQQGQAQLPRPVAAAVLFRFTTVVKSIIPACILGLIILIISSSSLFRAVVMASPTHSAASRLRRPGTSLSRQRYRLCLPRQRPNRCTNNDSNRRRSYGGRFPCSWGVLLIIITPLLLPPLLILILLMMVWILTS